MRYRCHIFFEEFFLPCQVIPSLLLFLFSFSLEVFSNIFQAMPDMLPELSMPSRFASVSLSPVRCHYAAPRCPTAVYD